MVLRWKKVELPQSGTRDKAKVADLREQDRAGIFETEVMFSGDQDQMGPCTYWRGEDSSTEPFGMLQLIRAEWKSVLLTTRMLPVLKVHHLEIAGGGDGAGESAGCWKVNE